MHQRKTILAACFYLLTLVFVFPVNGLEEVSAEKQPCNSVEIFTREGCPHCANASNFLYELQSEYPHVKISYRDVFDDENTWKEFVKLNKELNIDRPGVPLILVCDRHLTGFDNAETSGLLLKQWLGLEETTKTIQSGEDIKLPWIGTISVSSLGLPVFTILIGLVDGFNPCAMWVLLMLLSLLVNLKDRRRILLVAGIFVLVSGLVYFAFMAAWLNLFLILGYSRLIQIVLGCLAALIGGIHMKDYFAFKKGVSLSIPEAAKQPIYARIRRILNAENLFGALAGVTVLAILVNLVELLCTAGLPALYTQILANRELQTLEFYAYLLLYNIAYMFDDGLMVLIAVYTLGSHRLQEGTGRWLKLLSGVVIFVLGLLLLFAPRMLV